MAITRILERKDSSIGLYRSMQSHWKQNFTELASKLKAKETKWPELNFISFLSVSIELLRTTAKGMVSVESKNSCVQIIGESLEDLTSVVTQYCTHTISLKELLKLYNTFIDTSGTLAESDGELATPMKQLEACLPKLFSNAEMLGAVSAVLQDFGGDDSVDVVDTDSANDSSRSVVRKVVLFLMKYGSLLQYHS